MILNVILNLTLMKTQSLGGLDEKSLLLFCKLTPIKVYRPHRLTGGGLRYLQMPCNRPSNQHCLPYLCFCQTVFPGGTLTLLPTALTLPCQKEGDWEFDEDECFFNFRWIAWGGVCHHTPLSFLVLFPPVPCNIRFPVIEGEHEAGRWKKFIEN